MMRVQAHWESPSPEWGSLFSIPWFYQFIKHISGRGFTSLTTNASALTEANAKKLVEAGLDQLWISFNGYEPVSYRLVMGGLSFEQAERNLKRVLELSKGTRMQVGANISVIRPTQDKLVDIRNYLENLGIKDILFAQGHNRGGFLNKQEITNTPMPPVDERRCDIIKNVMFIAWTGEVLSCCHDLAGENVIGDLRAESVAAIKQKTHKLIEQGVNFRICGYCNDLYRFVNYGTLDGLPLAEWVYDLHAAQPPEVTRGGSSLSQWLYSIYARDGKSGPFFQRVITSRAKLEEQLICKEQAFEQSRQETAQLIASLEARTIQSNTAAQQEIHAFKGYIQEIQGSRGWRFLEKIRELRLALLPAGSRREKLFYKIFK